MSVRFNPWSDEMACGKTVIVYRPRRNYECACMRRDGHEGGCIALACDAATADGVLHCCRMPLDMPHHPKCPIVVPNVIGGEK